MSYSYNPTLLTTTQTVAPTAEPLTLEEVREHGRIDATEEDSLITSMIKAARAAIESYLNRDLMQATYTSTYECFPGKWGRLHIDRRPVSSVTSVTYIDTNGDTQTLSTDIYQLVKGSTYGYLTPKYNQYWPDTRTIAHAEVVTITYVVGASSVNDVPDSIRTAMKMLVLDLYENREASAEKRLSDNQTYKMLLDLYRIPGVA